MEEERAGAGVIHGGGDEDEDEVGEEGVPHVEGDVPGDSWILTYRRIAVHASSPPTGVLNPSDTLHASTTIMNQVLQHRNHRRVLFRVFFDVPETDVVRCGLHRITISSFGCIQLRPCCVSSSTSTPFTPTPTSTTPTLINPIKILPPVFLVRPSSRLVRMHDWPVLPSVVVIIIPDVGGGRREFVVWGGGRGSEFSRGGGSERRSWMIWCRWW
ncbi:hypothetical protein F5879DRAFT_607043 [Lentinula edodes]|nr:hypothetical protein F5879DRAFT_607043 [Lentinula edodes]